MIQILQISSLAFECQIIVPFSKSTLVVTILIYGILAIITSNFFGKLYGL
jgi:hypothetical protein